MDHKGFNLPGARGGKNRGHQNQRVPEDQVLKKATGADTGFHHLRPLQQQAEVFPVPDFRT